MNKDVVINQLKKYARQKVADLAQHNNIYNQLTIYYRIILPTHPQTRVCLLMTRHIL